MLRVKYMSGKDRQLFVLIALNKSNATVGELGSFIRPRAEWVAKWEAFDKLSWAASDYDYLSGAIKMLVRDGLAIDTGLTRSPNARVYDITPAGKNALLSRLESHPQKFYFQQF